MRPSGVEGVIGLHGKDAPTVNIEIRDTSGALKRLDDQTMHAKFPTILKSVAQGVPVLMVGPAGSGKSILAENVAKALDLPFAMTGAIDSPYKVTGFIDAQGRYAETDFFRELSPIDYFVVGRHALALYQLDGFLAEAPVELVERPAIH